jgi:hypothetical protein
MSLPNNNPKQGDMYPETGIVLPALGILRVTLPDYTIGRFPQGFLRKKISFLME